jgi:ferredoxin-NADP reductase
MAQQLKWQLGTVVVSRQETPKVKSLILDVPVWTTHLAGQHVDVRLTAEDGYQAQRSYSIASPPDDKYLMLTVARIEDGEVSPYLTDELRRRRPIRVAWTDRWLFCLESSRQEE